MKELEKYLGRKLTTDEVAEAYNWIDETKKRLEELSLDSGEDYLLLKWGTIKIFGLKSDKGKKLLDEYNGLGVSAGAMSQKDTAKQSEIICKMIEECDGVIQNDWDGKYYTKEEAKKYILDYQITK